MYPYVFVAGPNKHDVLFVSRVPADCEILTPTVQSSMAGVQLDHLAAG
jgi:hypothetical protein